MNVQIVFFDKDEKDLEEERAAYELMILLSSANETVRDEYLETIFRVQDDIPGCDFTVTWLSSIIAVRSLDKAAMMTLKLVLS
jgi:hypothetical protein